MVNERLIKQITAVYTEIIKKTTNPKWKFPQGGLAMKCLDTFITSFTKDCGGVFNSKRMVDYCICQAHTFRDFTKDGKWKPAHSFGPNALKKYGTKAYGKKFYEDKWLATGQLTRQHLYGMVEDKRQHPQAKYIYMPSEEITKDRYINSEIGYFLCQNSTLGWSPLSDACLKCKYIESCKKETERRFPELYRIRIEYGQGN